MKKLQNRKRNLFKAVFFGLLSSLFFKKKANAGESITEFEKNTGFRNYGFPSKFERIYRWIVANPVNKGNGVSYTPLSKLEGTLVPNGLHFERHHYGVEHIDPSKYHLSVVVGSKELKLSLDLLKNMKMFTKKTFIECGGNSNVMYNPEPLQTSVDLIHGLFSFSEWTGIKLETIFGEKDINKLIKGYEWVEFISYDKGNYNISLPLQYILEEGFLAIYQNGESIRPEQGYPLRLIIPGWEGSTHVKWLKKIIFRKKPAFTRNETSRYTDLLPSGKSIQYSFKMDSKSVILNPSHGQKINKGMVNVSGLAWSGSSFIKKVEISFDNGRSWKNVKLHKKNVNLIRFNYSFFWKGNEMIIQSRCVDGKNKKQKSRINFLKKMGKNAYYHYSGITSWLIDDNGNVRHTY